MGSVFSKSNASTEPITVPKIPSCSRSPHDMHRKRKPPSSGANDTLPSNKLTSSLVDLSRCFGLSFRSGRQKYTSIDKRRQSSCSTIVPTPEAPIGSEFTPTSAMKNGEKTIPVVFCKSISGSSSNYDPKVLNSNIGTISAQPPVVLKHQTTYTNIGSHIAPKTHDNKEILTTLYSSVSVKQPNFSTISSNSPAVAASSPNHFVFQAVQPSWSPTLHGDYSTTMGNANRVSFSRPHQHASPYGRSNSINQTPASVDKRPYVSPLSAENSPYHQSCVTKDSGLTGSSFETQSPPTQPLSLLTDWSSNLRQTDSSNSITGVDNEYKDVSSHSLLSGQFNRLRLSSDMSSLCSDDLMLDTEILSSPGPDSIENPSEVKYWKDTFGIPPSSKRFPTIFSNLASVTELSHDDLTRVDAARTPTTPNATANSFDTDAPPSTPAAIQYRWRCICPDVEQCTCKASSLAAMRRNRPKTISGPINVSSRSSFRRLNSFPSRRRTGSYSGSDDFQASFPPGERSFTLLSSDQRQMLHDIQEIKLTLLKVRRLLVEDQWHLPLFSGSLTSPTMSQNVRVSLPLEWLEHTSSLLPAAVYESDPEVTPLVAHSKDEVVNGQPVSDGSLSTSSGLDVVKQLIE